jgi:hypothetical protein
MEFCFTGPSQPVDRLQVPTEAFDLLFGGFASSGGSPTLGGESDAARRRRLRQQSVLDAVKSNIAEVTRRLGPSDRRVVDGYLSRVREIERRIANQARESSNDACQPVRPAVTRSPERARPTPQGFSPEYDVDVGSRAMVDLAVMALTCDLTRVITLGYRQPSAYEWLRDARGNKIMVNDWHLDVVHVGGGTRAAPTPQRDALFRVQQYYHQELAYLLERLKATPEGDGNLLDSTLVLYVNEFGNGALHGHGDKPCLIAGRAGGAIRPGRWIDAAGPHNRLLLSVLQAFGIEQASFGDPRFCARGPFTGLT